MTKMMRTLTLPPTPRRPKNHTTSPTELKFFSLKISLVLLLFYFACITVSACRDGHSLRHRILSAAFQCSFRRATPDDVSVARQRLLQEAMNPLSISTKTLLVAYDSDANSDDDLLGFGQIRPLDNQWSELASLYVLPEFRTKGIGSALVQQLLEDHDDDDSSSSSQSKSVCLLTLRPTISFYEPFGFSTVTNEDTKELPVSIQVEEQIGRGISKLLGNELVCMVRRTQPD